MRTDAELREAYLEMRKRKPASRRKRIGTSPEEDRFLARQATVLIGDPKWDWMLVEIGKRLDARRSALAAAREKIFAQKALPDSQLRTLREIGLVQEAAIEELEFLLGLPKQAIENAQEKEEDVLAES